MFYYTQHFVSDETADEDFVEGFEGVIDGDDSGKCEHDNNAHEFACYARSADATIESFLVNSGDDTRDTIDDHEEREYLQEERDLLQGSEPQVDQWNVDRKGEQFFHGASI